MRLYGKKKDHCNSKWTRSNRGRVKHTTQVQWRRWPRTRNDEYASVYGMLRKRARVAGQREIANEVFDSVLAAHDPDTWLHGQDLTAWKDLTQRKPLYVQAPYDLAEDWYFIDDDWERDYPNYDFDEDDDYFDDEPTPTPMDKAWVHLWLNGDVDDEYSGSARDSREDLGDYLTYFDDDCDDYWPTYEQPLPDIPNTVLEERDMERRKAGERFFRQNRRTVFKPLGLIV